jgi:hypothetical protein
MKLWAYKTQENSSIAIRFSRSILLHGQMDKQIYRQMDREINNYLEDMVVLGYDIGLSFREL